MDYNLTGSSIHGILQARNTGVGCHTLFQVIFPGPKDGNLILTQIMKKIQNDKKNQQQQQQKNTQQK